MKVTVAICTWNRSELLRQTLKQMERLRIPGDVELELLVVDNASTDNTREVIESFGSKLPIKYLFQIEQGHSHSRNKAVENTTGEIILWTDNDVLVDPDWLTELVDGAKKNPDAAFFGGKIEPVFEQAQAEWLQQTWNKCSPAYAVRDLGDDELRIPPASYPFGANFAVRTEIQKAYLYDTRLGRVAGGMLGDDEINVLMRIVEAGHHGVWLPRLKIKHFIPNDRATPDYVYKYFVGQGIANLLKDRATMKSRFHAFRVTLFNQLCYRWKKKRSHPDEWISHLIRAAIAWGECMGWPHRGESLKTLSNTNATGVRQCP